MAKSYLEKAEESIAAKRAARKEIQEQTSNEETAKALEEAEILKAKPRRDKGGRIKNERLP